MNDLNGTKKLPKIKIDDMFNIIEGRHKDSFDELCELLIKEVPNGLM